MRIDNRKNRPATQIGERISKKATDSGKLSSEVSSVRPSSFSDILSEQNENFEQRYSEEFQQLLKDFEEESEQFKKELTLERALKYKEKLRRVLDYLIKRAYGIKTSQKGNFLKKTIFFTVQRIEENMEHIIKEILSQERNNVAILAKIDDIAGLLFEAIR